VFGLLAGDVDEQASAMTFTGMLMLTIETAAWITSSMFSRLCRICFRSEMP